MLKKFEEENNHDDWSDCEVNVEPLAGLGVSPISFKSFGKPAFKKGSWEWTLEAPFLILFGQSSEEVAECFEKRLKSMMGQSGEIVDDKWGPSKCEIIRLPGSTSQPSRPASPAFCESPISCEIPNFPKFAKFGHA